MTIIALLLAQHGPEFYELNLNLVITIFCCIQSIFVLVYQILLL